MTLCVGLLIHANQVRSWLVAQIEEQKLLPTFRTPPAPTQVSVAFDGLPKTCPIASPPLVVLVVVAHRVFAFWVGNCQKLEVAPFATHVPTSRQLIAYPVAHRFTTTAVYNDPRASNILSTIFPYWLILCTVKP